MEEVLTALAEQQQYKHNRLQMKGPKKDNPFHSSETCLCSSVGELGILSSSPGPNSKAGKLFETQARIFTLAGVMDLFSGLGDTRYSCK